MPVAGRLGDPRPLGVRTPEGEARFLLFDFTVSYL